MNGINSYNYGLTALVPSGASYSAEELNVPPSRRMSAPAPAAANDAGREYVYISYFEDGSVRSASLLSGGSVLYEDILGTSALAEKQLSIEVFPCGSGTYFVTDKGESGAHDKELYVLRAGSDTLEPVYVGSGQT